MASIQDALNLFNLPFNVSEIQENDISVMYGLQAAGAGATLNRLNSRLKDIQAYTGEQITVVIDGGLWLRVDKPKKPVFNFSDYNGYVYKRYGSMELPYMVGLTSDDVIIDDLTKAPHLLVAGTTGSGKSNFIHTLIDSLVSSGRCNLFMIDCKKVEFNVYRNNQYVVDDLAGAYKMTAYFTKLIDKIYADMKQAGVNDFKELRKINPELRYNVLIVDELADLILDKKSRDIIVPRLLRIAQIGRAAGCHLVLATQRPDHTVINGTLKGNIPTRIAFNCISRMDSQVILDRPGAEYLTGNGDGLFLKNGSRALERFQACYLPLDEIKKVYPDTGKPLSIDDIYEVKIVSK